MSSVATQTCVPLTIEAGTTVRFTVSNASYPATAWTLAFVLNNGVDTPLTVAATASGSTYAVVLTAEQTLALTPGRYTWGEIYTAVSPATEKAVGDNGSLDVLASIATVATPTAAQAMVTLLKGALQKFAVTDLVSFSSTGHSFTRANIAEYQKQLVFWEARVIAEQNRASALRGNGQSGAVGISFARPRTTIGVPSWPQ